MSGSHRARWTPAAVVRATAGPVMALAAVGALIGLLVLLNGRPDLQAGPAVQAPSTSVANPSTLGGGSPEPSAAAVTTTAPATHPATAPSTPAAVPATQPPKPAARAPLTVLNNSTVPGLAASAADRFRAGGWHVADVGNFTGRIARSTVYYEPGQEVAARALAAQFPQVARVLPRFAGLPGSGLTVVVTRDFPH